MEKKLDMFDAVIADLKARSAHGRKSYPDTPALNYDRYDDWMKEAYEEALDLVIYLRGGIERQKQREKSWAEKCALPAEWYDHTPAEQAAWIETGAFPVRR